MVDIESLHFDRESRERYLQELSKEIEHKGYPECNPDLVYSLLDSTFARDIAEEIGHREFAHEIQEQIDGVLNPFEQVDPEKKQLGEFTGEELSVKETSPLFYEALGSFTETSEGVVHGGDIANEFINARKRYPAKESLSEFEDWLQAEVEGQLEQLDQDMIEGESGVYTLDEYEDTAVYNGLRFLLYRRENMEPFSSQEIQVP